LYIYKSKHNEQERTFEKETIQKNSRKQKERTTINLFLFRYERATREESQENVMTLEHHYKAAKGTASKMNLQED
jgi:hypothetical protein